MIKAFINKKEVTIVENTCIRTLLEERKIKKAAVWVNDRQLLQTEYDTCVVQPGDEIKILRIMAGG